MVGPTGAVSAAIVPVPSSNFQRAIMLSSKRPDSARVAFRKLRPSLVMTPVGLMALGSFGSGGAATMTTSAQAWIAACMVAAFCAQLLQQKWRSSASRRTSRERCGSCSFTFWLSTIARKAVSTSGCAMCGKPGPEPAWHCTQYCRVIG